jgi:hypothetical protein
LRRLSIAAALLVAATLPVRVTAQTTVELLRSGKASITYPAPQSSQTSGSVPNSSTKQSWDFSNSVSATISPGRTISSLVSSNGYAELGMVRVQNFASAHLGFESGFDQAAAADGVLSIKAGSFESGVFTLDGYATGTPITIRYAITAPLDNAVGTSGLGASASSSYQVFGAVGGQACGPKGSASLDVGGFRREFGSNGYAYYACRTIRLGELTTIGFGVQSDLNVHVGVDCLKSSCNANEMDAQASFQSTMDFLWGGVVAVDLQNGTLEEPRKLHFSSPSGFDWISARPGVDVYVPPTTVPEPSSFLLLAAALGALACGLRLGYLRPPRR